MKLGEKLRRLREVEGSFRGLDRAMTQQEVVRAMREEQGSHISQGYLSQIESGSRPHLTNSTRQLLARFFNVHPGYLVDDPDGFHTELLSDLRLQEETLDDWLLQGANRFAFDQELSRSLRRIAEVAETRQALVLLASILDSPGVAERLSEALGASPKESQ